MTGSRGSISRDRGAHGRREPLRIAAGPHRPSEADAEWPRKPSMKYIALPPVVHHRDVALMLDDADDLEALGLDAA